MAKSIPLRQDIPEEFTWDLTDIFPSDEAWMDSFEALKAAPAKVAAYAGKLGSSARTLLDFLQQDEELDVLLMSLYGYAHCKADQDAGNSKYTDMKGKAMNTMVAVSSAAAFATPEIMAIDDETLEGFFAEKPELEKFRRPIFKIRRGKEHTLSPESEAILAAARQISSAPNNIGSVFRRSGDRLVTSTLTNLGRTQIPTGAEKLIRRFEFQLGSPATPRCNCAALTCKNELRLIFSSNIRETTLPRETLRFLVREGIKVEVESNLEG